MKRFVFLNSIDKSFFFTDDKTLDIFMIIKFLSFFIIELSITVSRL